MSAYKTYLKKKFTRARIYGLLFSLAGIAIVLLYFLTDLNRWLLMISLGYVMGAIFMSNITYQDIRVGSPWPKINACFAVLFYFLSIAIMIYGFTTGELSII